MNNEHHSAPITYHEAPIRHCSGENVDGINAASDELEIIPYLYFAGLIGLSTVTAFFAYTFGLGRLPASIAGILAMAEIAFVSVYAYFLLSERMVLTQITGTILVIVGVVILFRRRQKAPRKV